MKKLSQDEQMDLLVKHNAFQYLSLGQIFRLSIWSMFNKKKSESFYYGLMKGKSVYYSYLDAKNNQNND